MGDAIKHAEFLQDLNSGMSENEKPQIHVIDRVLHINIFKEI